MRRVLKLDGGEGAEPAAPTRRAPLVVAAIAAAVVAFGLAAGALAGDGHPDLSASDADPAHADATVHPGVTIALAEVLNDARLDADADPLPWNAQAARVARDWARVMADSEGDEELGLALCADLTSDDLTPVWHPSAPHDDLGASVAGEIGEVVACKRAGETREAIEGFVDRRLAQPEQAAELLEDDRTAVGTGAVRAESGALFVTWVLAESVDDLGTEEVGDALDAARDRIDGQVETTAAVLAAAGDDHAERIIDALGDDIALLRTEHTAADGAQSVLNPWVRQTLGELLGEGGRVVAVGGDDELSRRASDELAGTDLRARRVSGDRFGASREPVELDDIEGTTHETRIRAVADLGVSVGDQGSFHPHSSVTRGQMATFIARSLDLDEPGPDAPTFDDVDGTTHEQAIRAAADDGIAEGFGDGTFRPNERVTRAQMASFLARGLDLEASDDAPDFDDVDGTHADAIRAIAEEGITLGVGEGQFGPQQDTLRGQMASFLIRALFGPEVG